jgi:ribonuclease VapC
MFLDASVIVAILDQEPGWQDLTARIAQTRTRLYTSGIVRYEASLAIARRKSGKQKSTPDQVKSGRDVVDEFLERLDAENIDIDKTIGSLAIEASVTYGKAVGHPADLNLGDCFAYACAKAFNVPLLYKGNDFSQTDLA